MQFEEDEARPSDEDPEFTGGEAVVEDEFIDDDATDFPVDDDDATDEEDEDDFPAADL